jgi:hypothetical protein
MHDDRHDWMLTVLQDMERYAAANDLEDVSDLLATTRSRVDARLAQDRPPHSPTGAPSFDDLVGKLVAYCDDAHLPRTREHLVHARNVWRGEVEESGRPALVPDGVGPRTAHHRRDH